LVVLLFGVFLFLVSNFQEVISPSRTKGDGFSLSFAAWWSTSILNPKPMKTTIPIKAAKEIADEAGKNEPRAKIGANEELTNQWCN